MSKVDEILDKYRTDRPRGTYSLHRVKEQLCEALIDSLRNITLAESDNMALVDHIKDQIRVFFDQTVLYEEENNTELSFSSKGIRSYFKSAKVGDKMVIDGYQCAMMPDGKIWQIENMRGGDCLYTDNEYGSYYTWEQAKKVVPKGFKLPTKKDFDRLIKALGVKTGRELYESIWQGIFSGSYYNGLYGQGNNGYYWSSTALDSSDAYYLYLYDGYVGPGFSFGKTYGFAVRCLIKPDLFRE